jgi:hypothetical protein
MKYHKLGHSDMHVSEVCLGTMTFGEQNTEVQAHEQLDYAISRGINFVDTAEMYPVPVKAETAGRTEAIVGKRACKTCIFKLIHCAKALGLRNLKIDQKSTSPRRSLDMPQLLTEVTLSPIEVLIKP